MPGREHQGSTYPGLGSTRCTWWPHNPRPTISLSVETVGDALSPSMPAVRSSTPEWVMTRDHERGARSPSLSNSCVGRLAPTAVGARRSDNSLAPLNLNLNQFCVRNMSDGACTPWASYAVRLSLDEPAAFRVAERCAQNLMHVEHRLGCEGCSVVTSMGAQRGVKTVEVRDSQAAKRNATDAWQYILLGHLAVPVVGSRAEPTFTRGEPAPAHESSQRHPARSVGACPCSGERCCKCLRRRFPASVSVRTHCPRCRVVIVLLAFGLVQ